MQILRKNSLHTYLMNTWSKFERFIWNNERDIHVQRIFVKNQISIFHEDSFS